MTDARIVRIVTTDDPRVILVKPDPALRFVMGRFAPARYDGDRGGYVLPTEQRNAFEAFARLHGMVVVEGAYAAPSRMPTPATFRAEPMTETRQRELVGSTKRGATLCRAMLLRAKAIRDRKANP